MSTPERAEIEREIERIQKRLNSKRLSVAERISTSADLRRLQARLENN